MNRQKIKICSIIFFCTMPITRCEKDSSSGFSENPVPSPSTNEENKNGIGESEKQDEPAADSIDLDLYASLGDLPNCDEKLENKLVYTSKDKIFRICSSSNWVAIDVRGSSGEKGAPGEKGPRGEKGERGDVIENCKVFNSTKGTIIECSAENKVIIPYLEKNSLNTKYDYIKDWKTITNELGWDVASSNGVLAASVSPFSSFGMVKIFEKADLVWNPIKTIVPEVGDHNDKFGFSLSIYGNTLVVGAPEEDSDGTDPTNNFSPESGAIYVFERIGSSWTQVAFLKPPGAKKYSKCGHDVVINKDKIAFSCPLYGAELSFDSGYGAVFLFEKINGLWIYKKGPITASTPDYDSGYGWSIDLNDDFMVVGAPYEGASNYGSVYSYKMRNDEDWIERKISGSFGVGSGFGEAISLDGQTLIVGALRQEPSRTGAIHGFDLETGEKLNIPSLPTYQNVSEYGRSVLIKNNVLIASSSKEAYVFTKTGSRWVYIKTLTPEYIEASDSFGKALALDGENIFIASPLDDGALLGEHTNEIYNSGAVYRFSVNHKN